MRTFEKVEFTDSDKSKLRDFDKKVIEKIKNKTLEDLSKKLIEGDISVNELIAMKSAIYNFTKYFK